MLVKVIHRVAEGVEPIIKKLSLEEWDEIRKWEAHVSQGHLPTDGIAQSVWRLVAVTGHIVVNLLVKRSQ